MFGNIDWFKFQKSTIPAPANIRGWLFYLFWTLAIVAPSLAMILKTQYIQSLIWAVIAVTAFVFDTLSVSRSIRRKMELENLFFIGEDDSHVSTENYELNLRNSSSDS